MWVAGDWPGTGIHALCSRGWNDARDARSTGAKLRHALITTIPNHRRRRTRTKKTTTSVGCPLYNLLSISYFPTSPRQPRLAGRARKSGHPKSTILRKKFRRVKNNLIQSTAAFHFGRAARDIKSRGERKRWRPVFSQS